MPPAQQPSSSAPSSPSSPPNPQSPQSSPSSDPADNDNEKHEHEDASTAHTLSTHNKGPSATAPPRKSNSSSVNVPRTNGSTPHKSPPKSSSSFLSKLFRALVPCVAPSSRAHPPDVDYPPPSTSAANTQPEKSTLASQNPQQSPSPPHDVSHQQDQSQLPAPDHQIAAPTSTSTSNPDSSSPSIPSQTVHIPPQESAGMEPSVSQPEHSLSPAVSPPVPSDANPEAVLSPRVELPPQGDATAGNNRTSPAPSNTTVDADDSEGTSFTEDDDMDEVNGIDDEDEDELVLRNGGAGIPIGPDGVPKPLLPPIAPQHAGRKCLVLDLDETLVHSSFKSIQQADYVVPVEIEYHWHNVYVIKRPGVDNFLKKMGEIYEVVVFTASLSKYADPVLDKLDIHQVVSHRLFRESCYNHRGNYVKDLSQLGRPIADTIILDNSPASYIFHPNNAVPVSSWFNDPHDTELTDLVPFLADLSGVDDVRGVLDGAR